MPNYHLPKTVKPCPVTRKELARLFWENGENKTALALRFSVSQPTVRKWFDQYNLETAKRNVSVDALEDASMDKEGKVVWCNQVKPLLTSEAESVYENNLAVIEPSGQSPNVQSDANDFDNESPWAQLSVNQRKGVVLLASVEPDDLQRTQLEQAELLNIHPETLINWKRDKNFAHCLHEMRMAEFKARGTQMFTADMLKRLGAADKSYTQEDRKLLADIMGLTKDGQTINVAVQVNTSDPKLKGRF